ncbi:MAG: hypothetical protein ABSF43_14565 [Rectinemataceae bacterium]|jgi:hypothetical protein
MSIACFRSYLAEHLVGLADSHRTILQAVVPAERLHDRNVHARDRVRAEIDRHRAGAMG